MDPRHSPRIPLLVVFLTLIFLQLLTEPALYSIGTAQSQTVEEARELKVGQSQSGELRSSESQLFKVHVSAGQYVRISVNKKDAHLSATLFSPDLQTRSEYISRRYGRLLFSFITDFQGPAYLQLKSLETDSEAAIYELKIEQVRDAKAKDIQAAAASRAYAEAELLRAKWDQQSLRAAILKYSEAAAAWKTLGDNEEQLQALKSIGECHFILSEYAAALEAHTKALSLSRASKARLEEMDACNDVGFVHIYLGENQQALRYSEQVLSYLGKQPSNQRSEFTRAKAQALNNAGEAFYSLSDLKKAVDYFVQALNEWTAAGDRNGQALAHLNLGYTYTDLGDLQKAAENYHRALDLWRKTGHAQGEALALTGIGGVESFLGEKQSALDYHHQAMRRFQAIGNFQGEAQAWNGIGQAYEDLNQPSAALDSYSNALKLYERIGNKDFAALSKYYIGRVYETLSDFERAREHYVQSIELSTQVGDELVEAHGLRGVGKIYESSGKQSEALQQYASALKLYKRTGDKRWQARTLNSIGHVFQTLGDTRQALTHYELALKLSRTVEDRKEEVSTLFNMASAESQRRSIKEALTHIAPAIELIESLRLKVAGEQLRTSYFASVQDHFELYIDLLMRADKEEPGKGFAATALQMSERARSRSLLETLSLGNTHSGTLHGEELLARERSHWQRLNIKLESRTKLLNSSSTKSDAVDSNEIKELMLSYQEVLERIKKENPIYAGLTQAQLLRADDIQAQVDAETVLLEYALGKERSYLWLVTPGAISGHQLPSQAEIEAVSREVYNFMIAREPVSGEDAGEYRRRIDNAEANYWTQAAKLSDMLLGPVASKIAGKRLLIVCDGILHRIPFDALPNPVENGSEKSGTTQTWDREPLVAKHEVVTIPSASVLSALQGTRPAETIAPQLIAVLADPVFDRRDLRVAEQSSDPQQTVKDIGDGNNESLPRLASSLQEARVIEELTSSRERVISTGFQATRETVIGGNLGKFRILHFATHGQFNDEHPELSGLVLSLVDESGKSTNGFLRADDIYGLQLNADLVVLSACRTGLGRNVNGEGILGVTRAFMYAGSRSVVASLWKVNDEATAELMRHFYSAMFKDGLQPAAALRAAKNAMRRQDRWRSPYYWAAFVMQGKYDHSPVVIAGIQETKVPVLVTALTVVALGAGFVLWAIRRRSRTSE